MGYDLHITRRKLWCDESDDITKEEFVAYVSGDVSFTYPGIGGADYADWKSPKTDYRSWLCWSDGRITTKNPKAEFIDKMVAIASTLNANVQGDDGEVYLSSTTGLDPESSPTIGGADPDKVASWVGRIFLGSIIALLVVMYFSSR